MPFVWSRMATGNQAINSDINFAPDGRLATLGAILRLRRFRHVSAGLNLPAGGSGICNIGEVHLGTSAFITDYNIFPVAIETAPSFGTNNLDTDWGEEGYPLKDTNTLSPGSHFHHIGFRWQIATTGGFIAFDVIFDFLYAYELGNIQVHWAD